MQENQITLAINFMFSDFLQQIFVSCLKRYDELYVKINEVKLNQVKFYSAFFYDTYGTYSCTCFCNWQSSHVCTKNITLSEMR